MRVTIEDNGKKYSYELPEDRDDPREDVTVFIGRQLIAWRRRGCWFGKKEWCTHCGSCCIIKTPTNWAFGVKVLVKGGFRIPVCAKLEENNGQYLCTEQFQVPFGCLTAFSPTPDDPYPFCDVKFEALNPET